MGLAAPQVGVNVRLMVFNETGQRGSRKEQVWHLTLPWLGTSPAL